MTNADLYRLVHGREPEPEQCAELERILARTAEGTALVGEVHTDDTAIRDLRAIAGAFAFGERVMYSCRSHQAARDTYGRLRRLVEDRPELRARVGAFYGANGAQRIDVVGGRWIRFVPRASRAGRGFSADCVVADERLAVEAFAEVSLTLMASARGQLVH